MEESKINYGYENEESKDTTIVFPTFQIAPLGIDQDEKIIPDLLNRIREGSELSLSSPYFNLTPQFK